MPRATQIVESLPQIELRKAGNPREVAWKVTVVDRTISPRRAAGQLAQWDVLLADEKVSFVPSVTSRNRVCD